MERITPKSEMRDVQPFCKEPNCPNDGQHKVLGEWYCNFHFTHPQPSHGSFEDFMHEAKELLEGRASEKGYNESKNGNELMDFTTKFFPGHSSGEVIYKLIRYSRKRNKEDLLKAAAWIYLIWRHEQ
jgi:hypothetical protein